MLIKFETQSARVKGLAFHSKRPWILTSLHTGTIQLWDYHYKVLIERFDQEHERHEGPVRGLDFHRHQPLFVSGGDDHKIKVWNYKSRRCIFTLLGHSDYIRTTFFHHEYPWILSASDDQTIRIWNWQSRTCISVLTGHNHYVMCAQFHPHQDLIVSAAIDQFIRVWDISGLRKKNVSPASCDPISNTRSLTSGGGISSINITGPELLSHADALVKHALDGHSSEVNWVSFHPKSDSQHQLIVSGADDNLVKLWRYNDDRCWEINSFRGHYNNVTGAVFHPRKDLVLSISEDRSVRLWDIKKRTTVDTYRRDNDRFWVMVAHPHKDLFAAGHDTGLLLFKIERERPAFTVHNDIIYYVKNNYLVRTKIGSDAVAIMQLESRGDSCVGHPIHSLHYNPVSNSILLTIRPSLSLDTDKSTYELYKLPAPGQINLNKPTPPEKRAAGMNAVFVGRDRYVVLEKTRNLVTRSIEKSEEIHLKYKIGSCDEIYQAGSGRLFMKRGDSIILFDTVQGIEKAKIRVAKAKFVVQNHDYSLMAIICKEQIVICNHELEQKCVVKEDTKIKSAAWDEHGVLIYTTPVQIKYTLTNGDKGTIRTMDRTVYITCIRHDIYYCLDRDCTLHIKGFDTTDYKFKQALVNRDHGEILRIIKNSNLIGQAPIAYLQRKGYPEIALHFVEDDKTRFQLALDCGNIDEALKSASKIDEARLWNQLAEAAMRVGNQSTAAIAYEKMGRFDRLALLYFVTGQLDKVREQLQDARKRRDSSLTAQLALLLGDYEELADLLSSCGQYALAYAIAIKYKLTDIAHDIYLKLDDVQRGNLPPLDALNDPVEYHLSSPAQMRPIRENWPLLKVSRGFFDAALNNVSTPGMESADIELEVNADADAWGDDSDDDHDGVDAENDMQYVQDALDVNGAELNDDGIGEWYNMDEQEEGFDELKDPDEDDDDNGSKGINGPFVAPSHGMSPTDSWCTSTHAVDHVLAGDFLGALQLLNKNVSVVEAKPFKSIFIELYARSQCRYRSISFMPSSICYPSRSRDRPGGYFRLEELTLRLKDCYALTNGGPDKFMEAIERFQDLLLRWFFYIPDESDEEPAKIVSICREYTLGLMCEVERRKLMASDSYEDRRRSCELVAYFTHCELGPSHRVLALGLALTVFAKSKEFTRTKAAFSVARRLLETGATIKPQLKANAEKLKAMYDLSADQQHKLDYDEHNPFVLCAAELKPIYQGRPKVTCPLCHASYTPIHKGSVCRICRVSCVG